ncbi:MAG: TonB family protein [Bacteroidetes bacterium]|nr:TonB family protein [Bacteroidota bacterium]
MTELLDVLHALGTWSTAALWLPLLAWTLLALPLYVIIHRAERWHPLVRYRLLQALLFTLPAGLVAAAWIDGSSFLVGWTTLPNAPSGPAMILLPAESVSASSPSPGALGWDVFHAVGLLTAGAVLLGAVRLVRLVRSRWAVAALHGDALAEDSPVQQTTDRLARALGVQRPVQVQLTDAAVVPLTYGARRPVILLPRALAEQPDALRMTLTHELIHIRRHDFLARWTEQLVAAVFAVHPGLPRLTHAIERAREMACDAEALRHLRGRRKAYADLLYGFSTAAAPHPAFAVSIAETSSSLKERIRAMTQLNMSDLKHPRYASLAAVVLLIGLGLGIVACSDAVTPPDVGESSGETATTQSEGAPDGEVFVVVEDRPELKGGMEALQERIQYPELAKKAGIEGRVFVQFIVNENGDVVNPTVTRGVHEALDRAALDAVKGLSFEPGKQQGEAVKVQMALPVTFKLGDDAPKEDNASVFEKAGMQQITIGLQPGGPLTVDGQPSRMDALSNVVKRKLATTDAKAYVALKVDKDVARERVNQVQAALRAANADRISYSSQ